MTELSNFGELIRELRKNKGLTLNKVAQYLQIDTSTLCKIEKNERSATKEIISKLSKILDVDTEKLMISFLSDKVAYEIWREENATSVLKVAEEKVNYLKSINVQQQQIKF